MIRPITLLLVILPVWLCAVSGWAAGRSQPKPVMVHFANEAIELTSFATTVGGFLYELSIELPDGATVDPPKDAALKSGMDVFLSQITVTRGEHVIVVPAELQFVESWHYGPAKIELGDAGQDGLTRVSLTIFSCNGHEVGRRQREEVLEPMRPQEVVCYQPLDSDDGPTSEQILAARNKPNPYAVPPKRYQKVVTMSATAYEPGPQSCGRFASGNTATGIPAGYGVVAVDPDHIPLGTRVFVEGYGYAVAADTGGAIDGSRIDVGMLTVEECYKWGRRDVQVYILY